MKYRIVILYASLSFLYVTHMCVHLKLHHLCPKHIQTNVLFKQNNTIKFYIGFFFNSKRYSTIHFYNTFVEFYGV